MGLEIRIPLELVIRLSDDELFDAHVNIADALGEETPEEIDDNHVKEHVIGNLNDDLETAIGNYSPDYHINEAKVTIKVID